MIRVVISYDANEQPWSHAWKMGLAAGIAKCGDNVSLVPSSLVNKQRCDVTVTWGLRGGRASIMAHTISRGGRHLVMERGFLGEREKYTALGFDGIAGRASFPKIDDPTRLARLFPGIVEPWRDTFDVAIVFGQVVGDATTKHVDLAAWYQTSVRDLLALGWKKVLFRPHPIEHRKKRFRVPDGAALADEVPILEALDRCGLAVTFNSTSAVNAVLHGVHAHAADGGSPAWDVASHNYAPICYPREDWAARLAWKQWDVEEIQSGEAWAALRTIARRT